MSLPPEYRRVGKRSKHSLNGAVPGVIYNRLHRGHRPATAPIDKPGFMQSGYLAFQPDAYEPHPGEMIAHDSFYTPYFAGPVHRAPDEIPSFGTPMRNVVEQGDMPIDHDLASWLLQRYVNEYADELAAQTIPFDHAVPFEGSIGPTLGDAEHTTVDAFSAEALPDVMNDMMPMVDDGFADAMPELAFPDSGMEELHPNGMLTGYDGTDMYDALQNPMDGAGFGAADQVGDFGPDSVDALFPESMPYNGTPSGLEGIVDEFAPPIPEPMMEDPLMDHWMMPGMGPPGFGPFGPMM